jgi:GR25 family glycosyltransferase involved in LPS biosynthesis
MKIEHAYILYIDTPKAVKYMEECVESCKQYGIPVTPFKGLKLPTTTQTIKDMWGFRVDPRCDQEKHDDPEMQEVMPIWFKEQLCLTGHLAIWKEVANKHTGAVAVFEHDALVKRNFLDVDVNDNEWTFLGYRMDHRDDYECVNDPYTKVQVSKFEGTHAYALTPNTARNCLDALDRFDKNRGYLPLGVSIDHMMGVTNAFKFPMYVVDPSPVIVPIEDKISYTQPDDKVARYNMIPPDGTLKGIVNPDKYLIDEKNNWMVF